MKKMIKKTIVTFTLVLSFLLTGISPLGASDAANANEGILLIHDGPSLDGETH